METLKGVSQIDGFDVKRISWNQPADNFIEINDDANAITFRLQNGPVKEKGVNGCQVDTLIETARIILEKLNEKYSCPENEMAIASLYDAVGFLKARKLNREKRGVEGSDAP